MEIKKEELRYPSSDGKSEIWARVWIGEGEARFILQISHGMCEYIDRYEDFALYVCSHGGIVCGNDHLGHGHTKGRDGFFGYFADKNGEDCVVEDIFRLTRLIKERFPGLPVVLLGHSMGSLMGRECTARHGDAYAAAVYSGTSGKNNVTGITRFLARVGMLFGRAKKPATMLDHLAFSKYNDRVEAKRTEKDWLTRDTEIVDKYLADPWCTFLFTDRAAYDFAKLIDSVSGADWAKKLPDIPYLLASGDMDPVGAYGSGVRQVFGWMKDAGKNISLKLYEGARHEIFNETNRKEVYADVLSWIDGALFGAANGANT